MPEKLQQRNSLGAHLCRGEINITHDFVKVYMRVCREVAAEEFPGCSSVQR